MAATAAPACLGQEVDAMYGPLPVFEFHSGFWVNLHHFLYHEARARLGGKNPHDTTGKLAGSSAKAGSGAAVTL